MPQSASNYDYDVIVIGAGPAGYAAAIRAAQLGFKTASIDHWRDPAGLPKLGGTYVNAGCIACISLLESAKIHQLLKYDLADHGLHIEGLKVDLAQMIARKEGIADKLSAKIVTVFTALNITRLFAQGRLLNAKQIEITPVDGGNKSTLSAKNIILASGSLPVKQACAAINNDTIINADKALALQSIPKTLGILGAGIIGLELAGIWQRMGAKVTLFEAQNHFLPALDQDVSQNAYDFFKAQGFTIHLGARVISSAPSVAEVKVTYQDASGTHALIFDKLIVAAGRKPNSENLAAAEAQLLLDENGFVHVDEHCKTNLPGVYAIGDLNVLGAMLAHKGIEEGIFVAEHIAGLHSPINYLNIPNVIYSDPEIAWVGQTEQTLRAIGEPIKTAVFPFQANAKAQAISKTTGVVKLITHAETDKILGVHIIGTHAAELIAEAVLAMEFSASSEDLARTIHAHPSLSSALYEAALMLNERALP
ncbi:MAG: dihydrolipoyl dehydrogenase [Methylococcaceae bacterium]|nr:dihydrolipoyl dehydrogenase [Methylococcaceae bacterium]